MSVLRSLVAEVKQLRDEVKTLRCEERSVSEVQETESNAIVKSRDDNTPTKNEIPVEPLIVMYGALQGKSVKVLKDDGCNTNVVSRQFVQNNRSLFEIVDKKVQVNHSKKGTKEDASEVILNGTLNLGNHTYTSHWVVADSRYDVLLGMPWHVANNPSIDYENRTVQIGDDAIPVDSTEEDEPKVQVTNMSVKKFRRLMKKKSRSGDFQVYQVIQVSNLSGIQDGSKNNNPRLTALLKSMKVFSEVNCLQDYLQRDQWITRLRSRKIPNLLIDHCFSSLRLSWLLQRNMYKIC